MAPRRNNKRPKPKKNLFTPEGIPDKVFNPMAGWQESPKAENSTYNKRTLECSEHIYRLLSSNFPFLSEISIQDTFSSCCFTCYQCST